MPDARFNADGTLQFGLSYAHPYLNFFSLRPRRPASLGSKTNLA